MCYILADLSRTRIAASAGLWKKTKKTCKFGKAFRSEIPVIPVVSTPRCTEIVRRQCPSRGNVLMYSCLSEHYLSWGMGKRPRLLLAAERAVYKKPLVGKLPHTAAQMLMIQRCNSSSNIWTQSVAQVHLEEIRLKCQRTWNYNPFKKEETAKDSKGPLFHSAGSDTLKPLLLTMFVYPIKIIKSNKQSLSAMYCHYYL